MITALTSARCFPMKMTKTKEYPGAHIQSNNIWISDLTLTLCASGRLFEAPEIYFLSFFFSGSVIFLFIASISISLGIFVLTENASNDTMVSTPDIG